MDKKRSAFAAPDAGRMTDAELSKRLGGIQRRSAAWLLVGLAGAVSGTVCFFTVQAALLRAILVTVLFFGGVCCAVVFGGGAQKKLKALMHEQLGDFFRSEWEKTFGPDIHTPEMRIDEPFMKALHLLDGEWETCSVENFHEGEHGGVHFSAANVRLDHVYQRGTPHEGYIVRKMVEKHILNPVLKEIQDQSYYEGNRREFGEFPTESGDTLILPARFYQTINDSSSHYSEVLAYSSNGNPREVVSKDKLHTVYLWGYGDRYLIAEIKNATLEQVETAVSSVFGMTSSALAKSTTPDVAKLKALRNHTSLSEAHVTTFTHLPLVGVTSISDPTGKTSYYDYDGLGRLKANYYYEGNVVEESKKRVVQEYDYHYRN